MDIQIPADIFELQGFPDARVEYLFHVVYEFCPGITDSDLIFEKFAQPVDAHVGILVNRGA